MLRATLNGRYFHVEITNNTIGKFRFYSTGLVLTLTHHLFRRAVVRQAPHAYNDLTTPR